MKMLLIHTCGAEGVVALAQHGDIVAEARLPGRGSSEHLIPEIRRMLALQAWPVPALHAIVVVDGPGSFTGVRVGLAAAKGLCEAGQVGLIAISRLELLASSWPGPDEVLALLDAGRDEFFLGLYRGADRLSEQLLPEAAARELLARHPAALTCEPRVQTALGVRLVPEPEPMQILAVAQARIAAGQWSDIATADANYLRRTDAELLHGAQ